MKFVIDDNITFIKGLFEPFCDVKYIPGTDISRSDLLHTDGLIVRTRTNCNAGLLEGSSVRFIGTATIGTDHIDLQWCRSAGIKVASAPGCNAMAVNQYVVSALLHLAGKHNLDLSAMTLGVVGAGNVGKKVISSALALGMKVLVNDPPRERMEGPQGFVSLEKLLVGSDIVTLHVPLNREEPDKTLDMVSASFFDLMKPGTILINSSRGEVVVEQDLVDNLTSGRIRDCAIDVWRNEPVVNKNLVGKAGIATPHIAGYSLEGKANAAMMVARSAAAFFNLPLEKWKPGIPLPVNQIIETASLIGSTAGKIAKIVKQTYDIMADDRALCNDHASFESLRNNYPVRHDFSAFTPSANGELSCVLEKMGFAGQNP